MPSSALFPRLQRASSGCFFAIVLLAAAGCECESSGRMPRRDGSVGPGDDGGGGLVETGALCGNGVDDDGDGLSDCNDSSCAGSGSCPGFDGGPPRDSGFMECAGSSVMAEVRYAPIDIIWVIDRSGSMDGEARLVQDNLNRFAAAIEASGIMDYRVVVLTAAEFVSVPPPLGTDPEHYLFIEENVQSNDGFTAPIRAFPMYSGFLRPDAVTHFVIVTDDESSMSWGEAQPQLRALLGHDFIVHTIASPPGSSHMVCLPIIGCIMTEDGCTGPGGDAADNGDIYWEASAATGGQRLSICTDDWTGLFDTLVAAVAVPTPLPCVFPIPEPPMGETFDRLRVNVVYTPGSTGVPETMRYVGREDGSADCAAGGWYYDSWEMPTEIRLCATSCTTVGADRTGRVDIQFGCATVIF